MDPGTWIMLALTAVSTAMSYQQSQAQAKAIQEKAAMEAKAAEEQRREAERQKRESLKRDLAARRARMAASGLDSGGGSGDAVLAGLRRSAETEIASDRRMFDLGEQLRASRTASSLLDTKNSAASAVIRGLNSATGTLDKAGFFDEKPAKK